MEKTIELSGMESDRYKRRDPTAPSTVVLTVSLLSNGTGERGREGEGRGAALTGQDPPSGLDTAATAAAATISAISTAPVATPDSDSDRQSRTVNDIADNSINTMNGNPRAGVEDTQSELEQKTASVTDESEFLVFDVFIRPSHSNSSIAVERQHDFTTGSLGIGLTSALNGGDHFLEKLVDIMLRCCNNNNNNNNE